MPREIDALTSFTLKHLRDRWWDASFTAFLQEALMPQAGERVLDVGCGAGTAELILSALQPGGVHFVGIDLLHPRLRDAKRAMRDQGVVAELAAADASRLPFAAATFDAAFAVAVLQHVPKPRAVIDHLRRVLRPGGRLVIAEPDNAARYWFSDPASGHAAFEHAIEFYSLVEEAAGEDADPSIGPRVPRFLRAAGFEVLAVHLVPVSLTRAGAPVPRVWDDRRAAVAAAAEAARGTPAEEAGRALLQAVERYAREADAAGPAFLEIQSTMLVVTTAQRGPDAPAPAAAAPGAAAGRRPGRRG
jgi:SAM-dependent methyltransferase